MIQTHLASPGVNPPEHGPRTLARGPSAAGLVAILALAIPGCEPPGERLVVATSWPRGDRDRALERFHEHIKGHGAPAARPIAVEWLVLDPCSDPARLWDRAHPPDVVLGGDPFALGRVATKALRGGLAWSGRSLDGLADPRELAPVMDRVGEDHGLYAELVRREAGLDPPPAPDRGRRLEPVVVLGSTTKPDLARAFALALADPMPTIGRDQASESQAVADSLLALMLESILIDARDELAMAGRALARSSRPASAIAWLVEPPPWPPASVAKLLDRPDNSGDELVLRLAESIAPDPSLRDALVRSWLAPSRPIDGALARELAGLAGGGLFHEPRLRDWLRAEWTAWARQRFRRVARLAAGSVANPPGQPLGAGP